MPEINLKLQFGTTQYTEKNHQQLARGHPVGKWAKEMLIYSITSFPRRREPREINELDPRLRGDDE